MNMQGVWLPIITPFNGGEVDYDSYRNLLNYYLDQGVTGIMSNATTSESPVLSLDEQKRILDCSLETINNRVPFYWGAGGNNTRSLCKSIEELTKTGVDGFLSVSPYYSRPSQDGIYGHFKEISNSTNLPIILYNIPYRTGMNMTNETILKLSEIDNIIGIKDSSGDINQSIELITKSPKDFHIYTGDDSMYYLNLVLGGSGGVLASAHLNTKMFIDVFNHIKDNNHKEALKVWNKISHKIPYLFKETNPGPIKYLLKKSNRINNEEIRLPLTGISKEYKEVLNSIF